MTSVDALDGAPVPPPLAGGTGLALPATLGLRVDGYVQVARSAESLGYRSLWAAEAGNTDAFGLLTACAAATTRIELATGVVPIFTRTPSLMAQSAATLQDASGGRFRLGLGVSSPTIVERWNGQRWDQPLRRMREYCYVVSELMAGRRLDHDSELYPVHGYRLLMDVPVPPSPLFVGALGPRMLALAGEVADGALLNWIAAAHVPAAAAHVRDAAAAAGHTDTCVAVFVRVCVTDDVEAARHWARRELMSYITVPAYRAAFVTQGWGEMCDLAMARWESGDRKAAAASLPDEFVDGLCIAGPAADVRTRFEAFRAAGADVPVAFPFTGRTDPTAAAEELRSTVAALAPDPAR